MAAAPRAGRKRRKGAAGGAAAPPEEMELARFAARTADGMRATEVAIYDLRGVADFADFFVVATAPAAAQRRAIVREIRGRLKKERGRRALGVEGADDAGWTLLDYGGLVVHLFSTELRAYYDLDLLWGDCPRVDWEAEA